MDQDLTFSKLTKSNMRFLFSCFADVLIIIIIIIIIIQI